MKAFLSHSSKDKGNYIDIVARQLTQRYCFLDSISFEEGRLTLDEIFKTLGETDIFVLFISKDSLNSDWVKKEILEAKDLMKDGRISRLLPIIIDAEIKHDDKKIPEWIKENYNLKLITRPTIAVRRIIQQLREVSWLKNPILEAKAKVFVGRNELISKFEERIDSLEDPMPSCIIASGIQGMGRRSLLKHCYKKSNIWRSAFEPVSIEISSSESIEDFIVKAIDLGLTSEILPENPPLREITLAQKVQIAKRIVTDISNTNEYLFIIDNGGVVLASHGIADWFISMIRILEQATTPTICLISRIRPAVKTLRNEFRIFHLEVPELNKKERTGLFKRHIDLLKKQLSTSDMQFFAGLLTGYPEQAEFAARLIDEEGLYVAKQASADIVDFSSERAAIELREYNDDQLALGLLSLLAEFEFISLDFLQEIINKDPNSRELVLIKQFFGRLICDRIGINGEYLKLNDYLRDYIRRQRLKPPEAYMQRVRESVQKYIATYQNDNNQEDISLTLHAIKTELMNGGNLPDRLLIPSHFLKTMKELYERHQRYAEVIDLADRILRNMSTLDADILREIRYFLCLALARKRNKRFLDEVRIFSGLDHTFLLGFYYRNTGRYDNALEKFLEYQKQAPRSAKGRRELVTVYLRLGHYDEAYAYAKLNYENDQSNPYHIQAYLRCLSHMPPTKRDNNFINKLITRLELASGDAAREMYLIALAEKYAFIEINHAAAQRAIGEARYQYPDSIYIKIAELEVTEAAGDYSALEKLLVSFEREIERDTPWHAVFVRFKCLLLNHIGSQAEAIALLNTSDIPEAGKERLRSKFKGKQKHQPVKGK